jgi:uncharacterized protein
LTAALVVVMVAALCGYAVQTITGFGAVVVTVTIGAQVMEIRELVLLVLPLSIAQCSYIALRYRSVIDWSLLARWIIPFMGAGTMAGAALSGHLPEQVLRRILAGLILVLALFELAVMLRPAAGPRGTLGGGGRAAGLLGAGLMHGLYATGGPLLVYTIGRSDLEKSALRSTLMVIWLVLNIGLVSYFAVDGRYGLPQLEGLALLAPALVVGMVAGERLHHRLDGRKFRIAVFAMLALAAAILLAR